MSARGLLSALEAMPGEAMVTIAWVRDQLAGESERIEVEVDLTLREMGELLHRSPETIRSLCAKGRFPGAYRLAGREWRVPKEAIAEFQRAEQLAHARRAEHSTPALGSARSRGDISGDKRRGNGVERSA